MSFLNPWKATSNANVKTVPSLPAVTPAEKQRSKQVEWLRQEVVGLEELQLNVLYQVQVNSAGNVFYIVIHLPQGFPKDHPELSVTPPMEHPWIDEKCHIVGSPLLKNFSMHTSLGRVVSQLIKEFIDHPPRLREAESLQSDGTMHRIVRAAPPVPSKPAHLNVHPISSEGHQRYTMPPVPETFSKLNEYSTDKLQHFLHEIESVIDLDEFITKLPIIVKIREDRGQILSENEVLASENVSFESKLEDAWEELQETFLQLNSLREGFRKLHDEHNKYLKKYKPSKVIVKLSGAIQESEHKSEQLAEEFLTKNSSVDDFLKDFLTERKLYYLRMGKQVRLKNSYT